MSITDTISYDPAMGELFNRYSRNDVPGKEFAQDIEKIRGIVSKAGSGALNLRRGEIVRMVREELSKAVYRHHDNRKLVAQTLRDEFEKRVSERGKPSDTKRLADVMEKQIRIKSMTDDEIETRYIHPVVKTDKHTFRALAFESPTELDIVLSELQSRGNESVNLLRESMRKTPRDAIGDGESAKLLDHADSYSTSLHGDDTVLLRDERGAHIGVSVSSLIDMSPLERVPA